MSDQTAPEAREGPTIPTWVSTLSILVAVLAVTALVWVLSKGTVGPGESVRNFYAAVEQGDCSAIWADLAPEAQQGHDQGQLCETLASAAGRIPEDIHVASVTLLGQEGEATVAEVGMEEGGTAVTWRVRLIGDRWHISGLPDSGALASA